VQLVLQIPGYIRIGDVFPSLSLQMFYLHPTVTWCNLQ